MITVTGIFIHFSIHYFILCILAYFSFHLSRPRPTNILSYMIDFETVRYKMLIIWVDCEKSYGWIVKNHMDGLCKYNSSQCCMLVLLLDHVVNQQRIWGEFFPIVTFTP